MPPERDAGPPAAPAAGVLVRVLRAGADGLTLSIPNQRAALEPARQALLDFLAPWALGAKPTYQVELVLEETLTNAIQHAYADGQAHEINLNARVLPDAVSLRFEDDGRPFDPLQAAPAARPATLDQARPGGLGLLLVRRLSRSVAYRRAAGRNVLSVEIERG